MMMKCRFLSFAVAALASNNLSFAATMNDDEDYELGRMPPHPTQSCQVGDILYTAGDSIGVIGLECIDGLAYDGLASYCGYNGEVYDVPAVLTCPESAPYCVNCGPRSYGGALCLPTPEVPDICREVIPSLFFLGNQDWRRGTLQRCEGDCDSSKQCAGSLRCFHRSGFEAVPGCVGDGGEGVDYCYDPKDEEPSEPTYDLTYVGNDGSPSGRFPLGKCQGDCDSAQECMDGLRCFQRDGFESVPGCEGSGHKGVDYCYSPNDVPSLDNIVGTAIANGFGTLVEAVRAAGLIDTLRGPGPFTVFAPTEEAFMALPDGLIDDLLQDMDALRSILLYHVVSGEVTAADAVAAAPTTLTTVNGATVDVTVSDGNVIINNAMVVIADVFASNGVIHVIDAVLIPSAMPDDPELVYVGNDHEPASKFPLNECEGDCDSSADCKGALRCFHRDDDTPVPGCSGTGFTAIDYCYDASSSDYR